MCMCVSLLVEGVSLNIAIEDGAKRGEKRLFDRIITIFAHDQKGVFVYGTG